MLRSEMHSNAVRNYDADNALTIANIVVEYYM